jgi:hypothetical protein
MNLKWVNDPKTQELSVSLTLMVIFALAALVINVLQSFGKVDSVAGINELFYSTVALYFSRRNLNFGGKSFSAQEAEDIKEKVSG